MSICACPVAVPVCFAACFAAAGCKGCRITFGVLWFVPIAVWNAFMHSIHGNGPSGNNKGKQNQVPHNGRDLGRGADLLERKERDVFE